RIIPPLVRIPDLHSECVQLRRRRRSRLGTHPRQSFQIVSQRSDQVVHHLQCFGLRFRREIFLHVNLSQRFAPIPVGCRHTSFPTWLNLLRAPQRLPSKLKNLSHKLSRQSLRRCIQELPAQISLPVLQRRAR